MLVNTWAPRATVAVEDVVVVVVDVCAGVDPAAAGMTLETSAAADAIIVEAVLATGVVELAVPVV